MEEGHPERHGSPGKALATTLAEEGADSILTVVAEQGPDAAHGPAVQNSRDHECRMGIRIDVLDTHVMEEGGGLCQDLGWKRHR
jgi:hypothetical protein